MQTLTREGRWQVRPTFDRFATLTTEVIEFSPTKELHETIAVIEKNMAQAG